MVMVSMVMISMVMISMVMISMVMISMVMISMAMAVAIGVVGQRMMQQGASFWLIFGGRRLSLQEQLAISVQ